MCFYRNSSRNWPEPTSASLASLARETGPRVVVVSRGGGTAITSAPPPKPELMKASLSDSSLKLTHVLYNLSPAGNLTALLLTLLLASSI